MNDETPKSSLTEAYDGWIKKITRRMFNKFRGYHQYDDLLSIAYLASVEAEKTYDPDKAKFSAYIKPRVEGAIIRAVSNISNSQHKTLQEIYKFIDRYIAEHGRVPAQHIILKHVGITDAKFLSLIDATSQATEVPLDIIEEQESTSMPLDTVAEYDNVMSIINTLPTRKRDRIMEFLDDPLMDPEKIQDIIASIRDILNIKETDDK